MEPITGTQQNENLKILFQDEHLCVINKPSGYVVHKTRGAEAYPVPGNQP